jgi:peptidoglycan-N-acetylglucosamine deacetylase
MSGSGWISLTFDDALDQHLDVAVPAMDAHGLTGTFYVHLSAPSFFPRQAEWRDIARRGHELGNHTVFHPAVASKTWVRAGNAIDHYSLDRMRLELEFASEVLQSLDGQAERTFAYPCSNSFVGHTGWTRAAMTALGLNRTRIAGWVDRFDLDFGATRTSYAEIVGELFPAGRGGGLSRGDRVPSIRQWDRTRLYSVAVENWTMQELQQHVTKAIADNTWAILQFHGVGGGHHMDCNAAVFAQFTEWLGREHQERVITVLDGAKRLWPSVDSNPSRSTTMTEAIS